MNIIICEDDLKTLKMYSLVIKRYIENKSNADLKLVLTTQNPNELEEYIESEKPETCGHSIFFLDIEFANSGVRGIDLAAKIRGKSIDATIIFITTHDEYSPITVNEKIEAFDFIYKESGVSSIQESIIKDLNQVLDNNKEQNLHEKFTYRVGFRDYRVDLSDIDYFQASSTVHKVQMFTSSEMIEFRNTLSEIRTQYPEFSFAHKSILANIKNINFIDTRKKIITFNDGNECVVSRRHLSQITKKFDTYSKHKI